MKARREIWTWCAAALLLLAHHPVAAQGADTGGGRHLIPSAATTSRFGAAVHLDGDYLLVGADGNAPLGTGEGVVEIFRRTPDGWAPVQSLSAPAVLTGGRFGSALTGSWPEIYVGAPAFRLPQLYTGRLLGFEIGRREGPVYDLSPGSDRVGLGLGTAIVRDGDALVVGVPGGGPDDAVTGEVRIYEIRPDTLVTRRVLRPPPSADTQDFGRALALAGDLLVVGAPGHESAGGIFVYVRQDGDWRLSTVRVAPSSMPPGAGFGTALAATERAIYVGAPLADDGADNGGGAFAFPRDGDELGHPIALTPSSRYPGGLFGAAITASDHLVVVGAPGSGVLGPGTGSAHVFEPGERGGYTEIDRLSIPTAIGGDEFGAAVAMAGGQLAIGAPGASGHDGAVFVYPVDGLGSPRRLRFDLVVHPRQGLVNERVNALAIDARGMLLLGTLGGGLEAFDGGRVRAGDAARSAPGRLLNQKVLTVRNDRAGRIWVGTEDGIYRRSAAGLELRGYRLRSHDDTAEPVVAILETRDGSIWTGSRGRLYRYVEADDRFQEHTPFTGAPENLRESYVSAIQEDARGDLWVLTKDLRINRASLYRVDLRSDELTRHPLAENWGQVGPMLIDSRDRLWIKAPRAVPLPESAGVVEAPEDRVDLSHWTMIEDDFGTVWIGTEGGLFRAAPDDPEATLHRLADWAAPRRPWDFVRSLLPLGDWLLIGTESGVFRTPIGDGNADASRPAPQPARVRITDIVLQGRDRPRHARIGEPVVIATNEYRLDIEFGVLEYTRPARYSYRYRLEGVDSGWNEVGATRQAGYSGLPPGRYTLRVEATESDGGPVLPATVAIRVLPAIWQTGWFRILAGALVVLAIALALAARRARAAEVERLRRRIARDLHDDLSTNLSGIALTAERLGAQEDLPTRFDGAVASLAETSRGMIEDVRDLVWLMDPGNDSAEGLVMKIRSVAESLLGEHFVMRTEGVSSLHRLSMPERRELLLICKELLHNAARHAQADTVAITIDARGSALNLVVEDDGKGFDPDRASPGNGLPNLRERARRLGGRLEIESRPGGGTRARFTRDLQASSPARKTGATP